MRSEKNDILKKTIKIAGITCAALGGAALIASGAALKALTEGAKFLKDKVQEIMDEEPAEVVADVEMSVVDTAAIPAEEVFAEAETTADPCAPV